MTHPYRAFLPTFIGGFRSGSTLLVNLLGLHPELTPWFETKEFCEALRWLKVLENPASAGEEMALIQPRRPTGFSPGAVGARMRWQMRQNDLRLKKQVADGKPGHERYPFGGDRILYPLAEAESALARWTAKVRVDQSPPAVARASGELIVTLGGRQAELAGRPHWVNKTPEIPRFGHGLRACLGECRVVLMVRNGWEVVRSALGLRWGEVEELAFWWKGLIEQSRQAKKAGDYLEVRYEDLVRDPAETLDQVFEFIGLQALGDQVYRTYLQAGGSPVSVRRYRDQGEAGLRARFDRIAGPMMVELGYE